MSANGNSQNGRGHVLGHVKDLDEDATQKDRVRIYRTNAKYAFYALPTDAQTIAC